MGLGRFAFTLLLKDIVKLYMCSCWPHICIFTYILTYHGQHVTTLRVVRCDNSSSLDTENQSIVHPRLQRPITNWQPPIGAAGPKVGVRDLTHGGAEATPVIA